jgi:hypothetical protein
MSEVEDIQIEKMISEYFKTHQMIKREDLQGFLASTELLQVFDTKENHDYFWNMTMRFTEGKEEVDKEACKNSLRYIFKINAYSEKSEMTSTRNSEVFNVSFSNNLILKTIEENNLDRRISFDIVGELSILLTKYR